MKHFQLTLVVFIIVTLTGAILASEISSRQGDYRQSIFPAPSPSVKVFTEHNPFDYVTDVDVQELLSGNNLEYLKQLQAQLQHERESQSFVHQSQPQSQSQTNYDSNSPGSNTQANNNNNNYPPQPSSRDNQHQESYQQQNAVNQFNGGEYTALQNPDSVKITYDSIPKMVTDAYEAPPLSSNTPQPRFLSGFTPSFGPPTKSPPEFPNYGPPSSTSKPSESQVFKHVSVHIGNEEAPPQETQKVVRSPAPDPPVHYNVIFIKAPPEISEQKTEIQLPPQPEQKTVVYLLSPNNEENSVDNIKIATPPTTQPPPPEVYFVRYKDNNENPGSIEQNEVYSSRSNVGPEPPTFGTINLAHDGYGTPPPVQFSGSGSENQFNPFTTSSSYSSPNENFISFSPPTFAPYSTLNQQVTRPPSPTPVGSTLRTPLNLFQTLTLEGDDNSQYGFTMDPNQRPTRDGNYEANTLPEMESENNGNVNYNKEYQLSQQYSTPTFQSPVQQQQLLEQNYNLNPQPVLQEQQQQQQEQKYNSNDQTSSSESQEKQEEEPIENSKPPVSLFRQLKRAKYLRNTYVVNSEQQPNYSSSHPQAPSSQGEKDYRPSTQTPYFGKEQESNPSIHEQSFKQEQEPSSSTHGYFNQETHPSTQRPYYKQESSQITQIPEFKYEQLSSPSPEKTYFKHGEESNPSTQTPPINQQRETTTTNQQQQESSTKSQQGVESTTTAQQLLESTTNTQQVLKSDDKSQQQLESSTSTQQKSEYPTNSQPQKYITSAQPQRYTTISQQQIDLYAKIRRQQEYDTNEKLQNDFNSKNQLQYTPQKPGNSRSQKFGNSLPQKPQQPENQVPHPPVPKIEAETEITPAPKRIKQFHILTTTPIVDITTPPSYEPVSMKDLYQKPVMFFEAIKMRSPMYRKRRIGRRRKLRRGRRRMRRLGRKNRRNSH